MRAKLYPRAVDGIVDVEVVLHMGDDAGAEEANLGALRFTAGEWTEFVAISANNETAIPFDVIDPSNERVVL